MADVESAFHAQRKAAGGGAYKNPRHRDDEHLEPIAESVNAAGETLEQRKLALRDTIAGFLADQGAKGAGWPIAWLARDPGRYLAVFRETKSAPATPKPTSAVEAAWLSAKQAHHDAFVSRAEPEVLYRLEQAEERALAALQAYRRGAA